MVKKPEIQYIDKFYVYGSEAKVLELKHHDPGVSLKDCTAEQVDLPILRIEEGRMELAF